MAAKEVGVLTTMQVIRVKTARDILPVGTTAAESLFQIRTTVLRSINRSCTVVSRWYSGPSRVQTGWLYALNVGEKGAPP
jgi:hypothetical protein